MEQLEAILSAALALPKEARGALIAELLESIEGVERDADEEKAWAAEIRRRIDEIDSGEVKTIPWEQTEAKLRAIVDGQSDS